jgi:hypothetical protein
MPYPNEWINHDGIVLSVKADTFDSKVSWKSCRVRALLGSLLDRLVWNKPGVSATAFVFSIGVRPPFNVAFVCVWHPQQQADLTLYFRQT